jgi:hypothetical protein
MNEMKPIDIVRFTFPEFASWVEEFVAAEGPFSALMKRDGVVPALHYLKTRHPTDSGLLSLLLGIYLAKSELPSAADLHASGIVLH